MQDLKMTDKICCKIQDLKMKDQVTRPENAGPENDGPGHFKADVVCIYAFCVVYNFFQIVITNSSAFSVVI